MLGIEEIWLKVMHEIVIIILEGLLPGILAGIISTLIFVKLTKPNLKLETDEESLSTTNDSTLHIRVRNERRLKINEKRFKNSKIIYKIINCINKISIDTDTAIECQGLMWIFCKGNNETYAYNTQGELKKLDELKRSKDLASPYTLKWAIYLHHKLREVRL
ncbi:hypothetical protein [Saccharolobus shibatae]|uniref:Uncharacterized protein n=1 Tax=Saccharolobus shibatae TaxID=2286 RepID=A0A8F5C0Q0_9CREN|nr:hypothetical protein [Saccharolobus shibatae]QXJ34870.1 hypothetical protein J5U22_01417 [Saccharolobus shibatae]